MINSNTCIIVRVIYYNISHKNIKLKDLNLPDELLVDCKQFKSGTLVASFRYLQSTETNIRKHLEGIMPAYVKRLERVKEEILNILLEEKNSFCKTK